MAQTHGTILKSRVVRDAFRKAWTDSQPGVSGGREERGFVVQAPSGDLGIVRWPKGDRDSIRVSPHSECKVGNSSIVASFHTPPNTGNDYLQEPGETDKRAVRDDPDLKGADYVGEFVLSYEIIFLITPTGRVREVAETQEFFAE